MTDDHVKAEVDRAVARMRVERAAFDRAYAFATLEAIESGRLDHILHRFAGAVQMRMRTAAYRESLRAGPAPAGHDHGCLGNHLGDCEVSGLFGPMVAAVTARGELRGGT